MIPNEAGKMVDHIWKNLSTYHPRMEPDTSIVMPNHFHGNLFLTRSNSTKAGKNKKNLTLAEVVQRFKTMTTRLYIEGVEKSGWTQFRRRLWQRNYYEHVIRSDEELNRIRQYIEENPMRWDEDDENPNRICIHEL